LTYSITPVASVMQTPSGLCSIACCRRLNSPSICCRSLTSRVTASTDTTSPRSSRKGTACDSIRRRCPCRPTMENSSTSGTPANTRLWKAEKAARSSAAISSQTDAPMTSSALAAPTICKPAGFISKTRPSWSTTLTHSGSELRIARNSASRAASCASIRFCSERSRNDAQTNSSPASRRIQVLTSTSRAAPPMRRYSVVWRAGRLPCSRPRKWLATASGSGSELSKASSRKPPAG